MNSTNSFEEKLKASIDRPEIDPAFVNRLEARLQRLPMQKERRAPFFGLPRAVVPALAVLALAVIILLASGPQRVLAQLQSLIGYIPGVGLVETSGAMRELAEPVSVTREGITIEVTYALLSPDKAVIRYTLTGVPDAAIPPFGNRTCNVPPHLRQPDGTIQEARSASGGPGETQLNFTEPFPAEVNEATLVFPCLPRTAPGLAPENWELPLTFKPASGEIISYPAIIVKESDKSEAGLTATEPSVPQTETDVMPAKIVDGDRMGEMDLIGIVEKPDSIWVAWAFPWEMDYEIRSNGYLYLVPFGPVFYDANGKEFPELDHDTALQLWDFTSSLSDQMSEEDRMRYSPSMPVLVLPKSGVDYPVYAKQNVYTRSFPEKVAFADVEFDGSALLASDQPLEVNQAIQIGSVKFRLKSIVKSEFGGYAFNFDGSEGKVVQSDVEVLGHPSNMSGSTSFQLDKPFEFTQSVLYQQQIPSGKLTVRVSQPAVLGDKISFIGSWSPEGLVSDQPAEAGRSLLRVHHAVEKPETYALVGGIDMSDLTVDRDYEVTEAQFAALSVRDAEGKDLPVVVPEDKSELLDAIATVPLVPQFAVELPKSGVAYPVTLSMPVTWLEHPAPDAAAEVQFDFGANPKVGDRLELNQAVLLGSVRLVLKDIVVADAGWGLTSYRFNFEQDQQLKGLSIALLGHENNGFGTFGYQPRPYDMPDLQFGCSFWSIPGGPMTARFSDPVTRGETSIHTFTWQPEQ